MIEPESPIRTLSARGETVGSLLADSLAALPCIRRRARSATKSGNTAAKAYVDRATDIPGALDDPLEPGPGVAAVVARRGRRGRTTPTGRRAPRAASGPRAPAPAPARRPPSARPRSARPRRRQRPRRTTRPRNGSASPSRTHPRPGRGHSGNRSSVTAGGRRASSPRSARRRCRRPASAWECRGRARARPRAARSGRGTTSSPGWLQRRRPGWAGGWRAAHSDRRGRRRGATERLDHPVDVGSGRGCCRTAGAAAGR